MKAFKAFIKPFEALQRRVKIEINLIFISVQLSEMHETLSVNIGRSTFTDNGTVLSFIREGMLYFFKRECYVFNGLCVSSLLVWRETASHFFALKDVQPSSDIIHYPFLCHLVYSGTFVVQFVEKKFFLS